MFKIGDKVRVTKDYDDATTGMEGIIKALPRNNGSSNPRFAKCYSVDFPGWRDGHDCGGTVSGRHGQWVAPECLELIESAHSEKIVITHAGKTTLARLYENNKVVKSAEAKCDPRDEFNFATGAKLAFERLMGKEKPKFDKSMLTNGRFGYMSDNNWFVVVDDKIIYKKGDFDVLEAMNSEGGYSSGYGVKYVVEAFSFDNARLAPKKVIWRDSGFDPKKVKE